MNRHKIVPILDYYEEAYKAFGWHDWWPGDTSFEIIIGAILTQNSSWSNVSKAIQNLKNSNALDPISLFEMAPEKVASLIKSSGYFNQKARKIKEFLLWAKGYNFDFEKIKGLNQKMLREKLLSIWGIGPETADSILLYAFDKEIFVADAYTYRIAARHHWWGLENTKKYDNKIYHFLQKGIEDAINDKKILKREKIRIYNNLHAQIVYIGHHFCRKNPICGKCPWEKFLPS